MRIEENTEALGPCSGCGKHCPSELVEAPISVLGVSMPSRVKVVVCAGCGQINHLPSLTEVFIKETLRHRGLLDKLVNGTEQILYEANYYRKKKKQ